MSLVLVASIAIRLAALAWTLALIRRVRDWRFRGLVAARITHSETVGTP